MGYLRIDGCALELGHFVATASSTGSSYGRVLAPAR
jgi:hypothetical protein